jgi:hypothetical protein
LGWIPPHLGKGAVGLTLDENLARVLPAEFSLEEEHVDDGEEEDVDDDEEQVAGVVLTALSRVHCIPFHTIQYATDLRDL